MGKKKGRITRFLDWLLLDSDLSWILILLGMAAVFVLLASG